MLTTDVALSQSVWRVLSQDSRLPAQCAQVEAQEGYIVLIGCVETDDQKRLAEVLAQGVSGVRHVENRLEVRRT